MITKTITLSSIDAVKKFVSIANSHPFDIDLVSGRYTINAKSIMGIFSLELSKNLVIQADCNEENGSSLLNDIAPFVVE